MRNTIDKVLIRLHQHNELPVLVTRMRTGLTKYYRYKQDAINDDFNDNYWVVCSFIDEDLYTGRNVIHLYVDEFELD